MDQRANRSGKDRRESDSESVHGERRGGERREVLRDAGPVMISLRMIPAFAGFTDAQYRKILGICSRRDLPEGTVLCAEGEDSSEMFVLLGGALAVTTQADTLISRIEPVRLIGEIGVFTSGKRIASVVAASDCTVIRISKNELMRLLQIDPFLAMRFLLNVVGELAAKLQDNNEFIRKLSGGTSAAVF